MRQPLSDEQDASIERPSLSSAVGRHASFLTAPIWQICASKVSAREGGSSLHSFELVMIGTDHN